MPHTALTPVFVGLRTGLHVLFLALTSLVIASALLAATNVSALVVTVALALVVTYGLGVSATRRSREGARWRAVVWLGVLTFEWAVLLWLTPEAAYLAFPLFFLYLHLLGGWMGSLAVALTTVVAICAFGFHRGWSVGVVVGPIVGGGVALLIGLGYQALATEAQQREALMAELIATRDQLAITERESGVLAERARLAREIHDTVAQGLSSIQMLLYAAERADPERQGIEHIVLARETASNNLAEARRFIRELTPPQLDDRGLGGALRRLADTQWAAAGLMVTVLVPDAVPLPMSLQTALLRIAQGAIANVIQHARARSATIALTVDGGTLTFSIDDDGIGFDPAVAFAESGMSDSFGLRATRERVQQLGGTLRVQSAHGAGSSLAVTLDRAEAP